ncbi:MAG: long-chain acyl-CoA synthetase [Paraglaciecola sp.]|jgi:long-chain acyl-CoA synthetase
MFFNLLNQSSQAIAAIEGDNRLTYAELEARCVDFSAKLAKPRQLIFLKAHNNIPSLVAYLAALRSQHPIMLLSPDISQGQLDSLIQIYQPNVLIENLSITHLHARPIDLSDELAILLSTSGSTGSAKQIALSAHNLQANARSICAYLPIRPDDRSVTTLPFFYSYGLSVINSHLLAGACIVFTGHSLVNREFWRLFKQQRITSFAGVPHSYEILLKLRFTGMELPSLRYFTQAGGRLSPALVEEIADYACAQHKQFFVMYGQTEATARMAYLPGDRAKLKPASIGRAIPDGQLLLQDEQGQKITGHGLPGELVYQGPNVMLGYVASCTDLGTFKAPEYLLSGDIAYRDEDGDFFITGRLKRFVKLLGQRISLDEVEQWLAELGHETYCCGDDKGLIVAVSAGSSTTAVEQDKLPDDNKGLNTLLCKRLQLHHSLIQCLVLDGLPLTASGKKDYQQVLRLAAKQADGLPGNQHG